MTNKLNQEHFLELITIVNNFHKDMAHLTWSQAFMRVYRKYVDKSENNAKLLELRNTADAFDYARKCYLEN